ncbi:MAG: family 10 glycosylhydrolase, partial [Cyanobacteria bacterium]|nr:family 10 glycosylhydrolase [Cyanobacteriota bacterium]
SDPLKTWMDTAHRNGLKVHVWFQTYLAGNQRDSAEMYGPILAKYPQWRNIQKSAVSASVPVPSTIEEGHYFLDPANPEVRQFLEKLVMELVTQYPVDGVNLDYIRYPASLPIEKPGYLESNWGYTPVALKEFQQTVETELWVQEKQKEKLKEKLKQLNPKNHKAESFSPLERAKGLKNAHKSSQLKISKLNASQKLSSVEGKQDKPNEEKVLSPFNPLALKPGDPLWPRWVTWRKQQVSLWVQEISGKIKASRPQALISAVVFPRPDAQYALKLQDWPLWVENKWVQALTPIGLPSSAEQMYQKSLSIQQITHHKVPVYVGIFGLYNRQSPVEMVSQIEAVHRAGLDGVVLFDGGRLTPDYWQALSEGPFRVPVK